MNIIYVTSAMSPQEFFVERNKNSGNPLNPSNQNFHHKMIKALSVLNDVTVISVRPISEALTSESSLPYKKEKIDGISFIYPIVKTSKIYKLLFINKQIKNAINKHLKKDSIIIADTLNRSISEVVTCYKSNFKVGIVTDNPHNISSTHWFYLDSITKSFPKYDAYITLTEGLDELANIHHKPHIVIEGIVNDEINNTNTPNSYGKYIFFGGALYKRYGVDNLIQAFKMIEDRNISLVIAGHGNMSQEIKELANNDERIKFLGLVSQDEILALERNAFLNINPRPFDEALDKYSVPSKTIEYMISGRPVISGRHTALEKLFKNEVIWLKDESSKEIYTSIKKVVDMSEDERIKLGERTKKAAISAYSMENIGEIITHFIEANSFSI